MAGEGYIAKERSLMEGIGRGDLKIAYGQVTPTGGSETVVTGLSMVLMAVANLDGAPSATVGEPGYAVASIGDQAGTPAAGSILINSYQDDFVTAAASGFEAVNWFAIGY